MHSVIVRFDARIAAWDSPETTFWLDRMALDRATETLRPFAEGRSLDLRVTRRAARESATRGPGMLACSWLISYSYGERN